MNNSEVFPLFAETYNFVKSTFSSEAIANYYQLVKRTEEESGIRFYVGKKRNYVGCLYIWRMRRSRVYYIGWWTDSENEDLFFKSKRQYSSWKKKIKPLLRNMAKSKSK